MRRLLGPAIALLAGLPASAAPGPVYNPAERAVSTWRAEAADSLDLSAAQTAALREPGAPPPVARCVKLNNYWCIKKAGWSGEIAADSDGHVAFATAEEGAAVAALLLKRYYVDFGRRTATAIVSRWAPAQCGGGGLGTLSAGLHTLAPKGLAGTLRARWLAGHSRGFALARPGARPPKRSVVADRVPRPMPAPTIAVGLGEGRATAPMTLDALLRATPGVAPSRSMIGMTAPGRAPAAGGSLSACTGDGTRIAAYAAKAGAGVAAGPDADLALFAADGTPQPNLAKVMANMAAVEIGPLSVKPALIEAGIAAAFRAGRNP